MSRRFAKYEGLGNDFVILDAGEWPESLLTPDLARNLCDRHRGIGGDGVLWVSRSPHDPSARMVVLNADGSRPEMCGNGVRCVVAWLADTHALGAGASVSIESDAGLRPAYVRDRHGDTWLIEVDMGIARVSTEVLSIRGGAQRVVAVDMGNPHGVLFDAADDAALTMVREVNALAVFSHGVNVEFVHREGDGFRVRVHERGVGWTEACGTGACAVAAAAVREGYARAGERVQVTLDGGALAIVVEADTWRVRMTGPARKAFEGML